LACTHPVARVLLLHDVHECMARARGARCARGPDGARGAPQAAKLDRVKLDKVSDLLKSVDLAPKSARAVLSAIR